MGSNVPLADASESEISPGCSVDWWTVLGPISAESGTIKWHGRPGRDGGVGGRGWQNRRVGWALVSIALHSLAA